MKRIPELVVFSSGNQYQKAASVLSTIEGCLWVAAINAALSIEIYLKSFLVTDHQVDGYKMHKKVIRGHNLAELYSLIDQVDKDALKERLPHIDLESKLELYKDIFTNARYMFEPVNVPSIGSGVVSLSKELQFAISSIIEERYPVKQPPHLQQAVDRALGKM
ncbi:hypothetical protein [Pseudoalteromonas sp. KAN5]|uniref:hypothetical protein n=1 Tax=Pseudoalteromonas sp. KAN5 TaxID=2916633 RepID=UPI001FCB7135|nr:hypothetical protein [Pseudoalteromonas sp. KAN5]BDF94056.1 hypothetical protein KAN5_08940 [Pseudoalteromonas sp. KAN5]